MTQRRVAIYCAYGLRDSLKSQNITYKYSLKPIVSAKYVRGNLFLAARLARAFALAARGQHWLLPSDVLTTVLETQSPAEERDHVVLEAIGDGAGVCAMVDGEAAVPDAVLRGGPSRQREQSDSISGQPCRFAGWPEIPTHVVAAADDRFFPLEFQKRVARERLNAEVEVISGGHLVALSRPKEVATLLLRLGRGAEFDLSSAAGRHAIKQERTSAESSHQRLNRWPPGGAAGGVRRRMARHHRARWGGGRVDTHR